MRRPDVDDATAHRELGAVLDEALAAIAASSERRDELVAVESLPRGDARAARRIGSGERIWAIERADATMTRGAVPSAMRQRSSARVAMT